MAFRTVKLRRLLGATALCGGMAIAATGIGAGVASADWGGPPPPPPGPVAWGATATRMGTTPATGMGTATASARTLSSVPSLLTGSVSKTSCRLVCQDILQGRIGVWLQ